jgi:hypothetical protein
MTPRLQAEQPLVENVWLALFTASVGQQRVAGYRYSRVKWIICFQRIEIDFPRGYSNGKSFFHKKEKCFPLAGCK